MSVFVKDMKMPKGCHSGCPLTDSDAFTCEITGRDIVLDDEDTITCRPSWCPLVEVPTPHGGLIDADALKEQCGDWYTEQGTEEGFIGPLDILLDEAPTVIEAEE